MSTDKKRSNRGQTKLPFKSQHKPPSIRGFKPFYKTGPGAAYCGDSLELLSALPDGSVNLVVTSPPYALHFKKEYGNAEKHQYVDWFLPFASQILRVLTDDGSFVLNIGGSYNKGTPTRSIYHFKLMVALVEEIGFHLAQELFWYNPAKMPAPAEWVTVRRVRVKDSVEYVWWFSKTEWPKASNLGVLRPYSKDMLRLNAKKVRETTRPSGHVIRSGFDKIEAGGSIPPNVIENEFHPEDIIKVGNNAANDQYTKRCKAAGIKIHPARFPATLPEFFIKFLTDPDDLVVDPFAGSNTTGASAERLDRRWIAIDSDETYLEASKFRFDM
ncbi:DNA-methyltransferase [Rubinisphaera margarita]|uniref:DNA-methyltransferase n=1 Tax=Rubinisphaera margarita TaxID=2909586 RepID=UPI001EE827C1|nr:site-specific DNA-methyltransferase [Rubinisphaera margarita]MCG6158320.1 site-specific DNA-methyltransferase [Rubinisphaera margarita]